MNTSHFYFIPFQVANTNLKVLIKPLNCILWAKFLELLSTGHHLWWKPAICKSPARNCPLCANCLEPIILLDAHNTLTTPFLYVGRLSLSWGSQHLHIYPMWYNGLWQLYTINWIPHVIFSFCTTGNRLGLEFFRFVQQLTQHTKCKIRTKNFIIPTSWMCVWSNW